MSRKGRPSDPEAIRQRALLRAAKARQAERLRDADPAQWGVAADIVLLPTAKDVTLRHDFRQKVVAARRSDAFSLLHAAQRFDEAGVVTGGISDEQKRAADRYVKDWAERAGILGGRDLAADRVDQSLGLEAKGRAQRMIEAGERIDEQHAMIGRADAQLLRALVEPLVMRGEIRVWREIVRKETGEASAVGQAAAVRRALENLRRAHDELDGVAPRDGAARTAIRLWRPLGGLGDPQAG